MRQRRSRGMVPAAVVVGALTALAVVLLSADRTPDRPALPNPNGYDDLVSASALVEGDVGNYASLDRQALRLLVATNAEALRLLRLGLSRPCLLPIESALTNAAALSSDLRALKKLAGLLAAEGRLRELDNQPVDAARSYTDAIRLGNEVSRGGVLITRLAGIGFEHYGCAGLVRILSELDRHARRMVVQELERVDAARVSWAEVCRNERYYCRHVSGQNPVLRMMGWWHNRKVLPQAEAWHQAVIARERLLTTELALRSRQSEKAGTTARLDDLVTNYLTAVPLDPFTGKPLVYRATGTNWVLYSVGPDHVDDGGMPAGRAVPGQTARGDLFYTN